MNPILVQQLAQQRMDAFDREAQADHLVALAKAAARRPVGLGDRFRQTAGHMCMVVRIAIA